MSAASRKAEDARVYRPARGGREQVAAPRPIAARLGMMGLRAIARLPFPVIYRLGGALGRLAARLPIRPVRFAGITIKTCFPDMSPARQRALARRSVMESARAVCELAAFYTWSRERLLGLVHDTRGEPLLEAAHAKGRGVIVVAPHLGAWELALLYASARYPVTAMYRRPPDAALDRFYTQGRTRFGASLAPHTAGGLRRVVAALTRGDVVALMPDQDPRRGAGVFAPFFGVPANTTTLVARLAGRTGAAVVLAFAQRLPRGGGFRLHFCAASDAVRDPDLVRSVSAMNLDIERLVRECPEQYLWSYKRFSVRPPGEANPYRAATHASAAAR